MPRGPTAIGLSTEKGGRNLAQGVGMETGSFTDASGATELLTAAQARMLVALLLAEAARAEQGDRIPGLSVEDSAVDDGFWLRRGARSVRVERSDNTVMLVGSTLGFELCVVPEQNHAVQQAEAVFDRIAEYLMAEPREADHAEYHERQTQDDRASRQRDSRSFRSSSDSELVSFGSLRSYLTGHA